MNKLNGIYSLIIIPLMIFSVFAFSGCEIDTINDDMPDIADAVLTPDADSTSTDDSSEDAPVFESDTPTRGITASDKGYANSSVGLSTAEFNNVWQMANLTSIVYHDLWDKALAGISPTLIPALDFKGNASRYIVVNTYTGNMGFAAELFRNLDTNAYVLVYRGTNALSVVDWVTNLTQALTTYTGIPASQYDAAVYLARSVKAQYSPLQIAGHSLGGGLAQLAALDTGLKATCFNAAGLTSGTLTRWGITTTKLNTNKMKISHYNVKYCPLVDTRGYMNSKSPDLAGFSGYQYGGRTRWLRNIWGTAFVINPLRVANHFYHAYVYQLKYTYSNTGNFL